MVSFEAYEKAALVIHQVDALEQSNNLLLDVQKRHHVLISTPCGHKDAHDPFELELERGLDLHDVHVSSSEDSQHQTLADDLSSNDSSHLSEESRESMRCDAMTQKDHLEDDEAFLDWRAQWFSSSLNNTETPCACQNSLDRCKVAMHQVLVNSDLKRRKLEYEVLTLRRLLEDAKLTMERQEQTIDTLEHKLSSIQQSAKRQKRSQNMEEEEEEMDPTEIAELDLRKEKHLNKLLTSRNQAMDENLKLKKQLLTCCRPCRERLSGQPKEPDKTSLLHDNGSVANKEKGLPQQPHRPTFQKAAFAMVQRIGQHKRCALPCAPILRNTSGRNNSPSTPDSEPEKSKTTQATNESTSSSSSNQTGASNFSVAGENQGMQQHGSDQTSEPSADTDSSNNNQHLTQKTAVQAVPSTPNKHGTGITRPFPSTFPKQPQPVTP